MASFRRTAVIATLVCAFLPASGSEAQRPPAPDSVAVQGYLRDALNGQPVAGHVHVWPTAEQAYGYSRNAHRTSAGRFDLRVPFGSQVTVHADGYLPQTRLATVPYYEYDGDLRIDLEFLLEPVGQDIVSTDPVCDVSGVVLDEGSRGPVSSTEVWIRPGELGALTNQDGEFLIDATAAGLHVLHTARVGYNPEFRQVFIRCSDQSPMAPITLLIRPNPIPLQDVLPG